MSERKPALYLSMWWCALFEGDPEAAVRKRITGKVDQLRLGREVGEYLPPLQGCGGAVQLREGAAQCLEVRGLPPQRGYQ